MEIIEIADDVLITVMVETLEEVEVIPNSAIARIMRSKKQYETSTT